VKSEGDLLLMQQFGDGTSTFKFVKESTEIKKLNVRLRQRKAEREAGGQNEEKVAMKSEKTDGENEVYRKSFTWEKLNYNVPFEGGQKRLLHDVYGYVKPGTLTALMGSSGAGE
jgi:ATP-binding cassette, subfamily G (WHITE), member 2, SNQ2